MISKKRSQRINENNMQRIVDKIYDDLNELIDAVNNRETINTAEESSGKEGDIRVVKSKDGSSYKIEGRTSEGWASASLTLNND
tara:strand:- start:801 stop:1052 length:252 start_codon:yes stop_codon:yes gene_type:complete